MNIIKEAAHGTVLVSTFLATIIVCVGGLIMSVEYIGLLGILTFPIWIFIALTVLIFVDEIM